MPAQGFRSVWKELGRQAVQFGLARRYCWDIMKLGIVSKKEGNGNLLLGRGMLGTNQVLRLTRELCIDCGICVTVCPQEAPKLSRPTVKSGRLDKRMLADFDAQKCTFCGICVVLCPANAIEIETNGNQTVMVVESKAFPYLLKEIEIDIGKCRVECNYVCQDACPRGAIEVVLKKTEQGRTREIEDVNVDRKLCIFCKKCESACPQDAVNVTRPFIGSVELNAKSCPEGCQVCVDICPSKTISLDNNGKPTIDERFCIYCGACQEACPEKAIFLHRTAISHTDVSSGAWITALERLTSRPQLVKELTSRARKKLREAALGKGRF